VVQQLSWKRQSPIQRCFCSTCGFISAAEGKTPPSPEQEQGWQSACVRQATRQLTVPPRRAAHGEQKDGQQPSVPTNLTAQPLEPIEHSQPSLQDTLGPPNHRYPPKSGVHLESNRRMLQMRQSKLSKPPSASWDRHHRASKNPLFTRCCPHQHQWSHSCLCGDLSTDQENPQNDCSFCDQADTPLLTTYSSS